MAEQQPGGMFPGTGDSVYRVLPVPLSFHHHRAGWTDTGNCMPGSEKGRPGDGDRRDCHRSSGSDDFYAPWSDYGDRDDVLRRIRTRFSDLKIKMKRDAAANVNQFFMFSAAFGLRLVWKMVFLLKICKNCADRL